MNAELKSGLLYRLLPNSFKTKRELLWLGAIILLAILLRIIAAIYLGNYVVDLPGTFDQISYDMLAQQVLEGHGFTVAKTWWPETPAGQPTAHWSYLYTLYLVAVYGVAGYHPLIARLSQAVLAGFLMPWLVYRLGNRHFSTKVGLVAAAFVAVYAYFVYYAATLMTETFYIMAILWVLDLVGQLGKPQSLTLTRGFLLGLALAIAVLLRQVFLLFVPILFGWLLWRSFFDQAKPVVQMVKVLIITTTVLVLAIAPWTLRNYQVFGRFVLLNTNAGFAFFWGNHPIHGYNFIAILPDDGPSYQDLIPLELKSLNEAELDQALLKRGLGFIQADPARYVILSISRLKDYFEFWPSSKSGLISNVSRLISFGLMWPFMGYGLILGLRRTCLSEVLILYLFMIIYTFIHLLSWALIRYRLPVDAILLVFASVTIVELWIKLAQRYAKVRGTYLPTLLRSGD
jgi:4-amino-4-deoxy-L-arabinose transferase-like glycosyltransferase